MTFVKNLSAYENAGKLLFRIILAAVFMAHAQLKFGTWAMHATEQFPAAMLYIVRALSILEPLAAVSLILGLYTRLTTACIALQMSGVIFMKINVWGLHFIEQAGTGWELDIVVFGGALVLLFGGSGAYSIENRIKNKLSA